LLVKNTIAEPMNSTAELTLGHIPYLNCVPFYHYLEKCGFHGEYVSGVPSKLNTLLQACRLDVSLSSSFEYARNWRNYTLLPHHSISSIGKVKSVLLFSPVELSELSGREIAITDESATSVNLLRIILREFYNLSDVTDAVPKMPIEELIDQQQPALLIGDRALKLAKKNPIGMQIFDLGELWYFHTGLPFVFALWMVSHCAVGCFAAELGALGSQLKQSTEMFKLNTAEVALSFSATVELNTATIVDYWQTIDYRLEREHLLGLQLFFKLCHSHGLLDEEPLLDFMS